MKFFVAVLAMAAAVCAEPEADPALLYAGAGYVSPYAATYSAALPYAYGAYPYAYGAYARGFAYSTASLNPYFGYSARLFKREAEAEAEADPALLYAGAGYVAPYAATYSAALPYSYGAYAYGAYPYAYGAYPYAYGAAYASPYFGAARLLKREAEAEAEADPALLYAGAGYVAPYAATYAAYSAYPYAYGAYAAPYAYGAYPYAAGYAAPYFGRFYY